MLLRRKREPQYEPGKAYRTLQIGAYELREGTDGRWNSISGPHRSDIFARMVEGRVTTDEYVAAIQQQMIDAERAHALLGKKVS